jgi:DNA polymerase III sliding clamp (beta) subunit (PCNA family)
MKAINVLKKMKYAGCILVNEKMAFCGDKEKFVLFPCNAENGFYDKDYFVKLNEWKFIEEIDNSGKTEFSDLQNDTFIEFTQDKKIFIDLKNSVSTDETRYFMNGILCSTENFVSTDGRTMLYTKNEQDFGSDKILYCKEFFSFYGKAEKIEIGENSTRLTGKDCVLYVKHIEGQFPNYKNVIPKEKTIITVKIPSKSDLEYHIKKCKLEKTSFRIFLTCNNSELVAFNAEFLLNFLKIGIVELYGFNSMKVFTGKTGKINALIMPMSKE